MCSQHPTRKYCSTCGKQFATEFDRVKPCLEFRLKGLCAAGVSFKTSWADDYKDQCAQCLDEEQKEEEARKATQAGNHNGKKKQTKGVNGSGDDGMETIDEGEE